MQTFLSSLRLAAARFTPGRAVIVAVLSGPLVGAMLAMLALATVKIR